MIQSLKERWLSLSIFKERASLEREFNAIQAKYSEPHRYYHTLEHVKTCLESLDEIKGQLRDPEIVEIALWLHDVIYDPKMNNNEEISSFYAKELLVRMGSSRIDAENIGKLIMATKHPFFPTSQEERYMVDIDLAILGGAQETYAQYSKQIRNEYSHIPNLMYRKGRRKVLETFLNQEVIYNTEYFRNKYEDLARLNLEREIEQLRGPLCQDSCRSTGFRILRESLRG